MLTADDVQQAAKVVRESPLVVRTPLLHDMQRHFDLHVAARLYLKLESLQTTGSFKTRGVANQIASLAEGEKGEQRPRKLVTMSAGNYGKAFALACKLSGHEGTVVMPETAPDDRRLTIEGLGATVVRVPTDQLAAKVDELVAQLGAFYLHSFDDPKLIAGHASAGTEILEDLPDPDVVLVCCGGGGLLAGVATALRLQGPKGCRIYGVEPEGAPKMYDSFKAGQPMNCRQVKTIAAGLAPPFAGKATYAICKELVNDIILVSDDEIKRAVATLYAAGFVVEPSGAAAFGALLANKVPVAADEKVVVMLTGRNITAIDLQRMVDSARN